MEGEVERSVLPNGLRLLIKRDTSAPVVAIVTYVKAGYFDETDDVVGIAHVLEHMYFKGTPTRGVGEIARETKAAGGYLNAATIYDHTVYYTVLPSSGWKTGLDVQFDAFANSSIDPDELRRELEVIIQEAKRKEDNPSAVVTETLYELLFDRHRMRRWRIGREDLLRTFDHEKMMRFYRNFYVPENAVLSIVGDVNAEEVRQAVEQRYGGLGAGSPVRSPGPEEWDVQSGFRFREWGGDIQRTQIAFGWRTLATLEQRTPALDMLGILLGSGRASRLYRGIRETQLASSVSAYNYTPTALGVFVVHAETKPDSTAEACRAIWAHVNAVRTSGIEESELQRAKNVLESQWVRRQEDMEGQANILAEWEALRSWQSAAEYLKACLSVTTEDVSAVAREFLAPERAALAIYRPADAPEVAGSVDAMLGLLEPVASAKLARIESSAPARDSAAVRLRIEREESGVRVYRTATGIPLLVRVKQGALVHAAVHTLGGARDERAANSGITHLLTRTALKGTQRRTANQIAEESENLGASLGASSGVESFGWSVSVPAKSAREAIDLLADVSQHPVFAQEALDTERQNALAGLASLRDDMYRYPMRLATLAAYGEHPYGLSIVGDEQSLPSLTPEMLAEWHGGRFLTGDTVLAIVGDGDPDELAAMLASPFAALEYRKSENCVAPVWPAQVIQRVEQRDKAQTGLAMLFPGPARNDDDRFAVQMIASVASGLGGRFFDELRDKQSLGYTVQAFPVARTLDGLFASYIATSPEKEEQARAGLLNEFAKLRSQPVTERELTQAQTYAIGIHAVRQQSGGAVLGDMLSAYQFGTLRELSEFEASVRAVTAEQMLGTARKYFVENLRIEGIVRGVVK